MNPLKMVEEPEPNGGEWLRLLRTLQGGSEGAYEKRLVLCRRRRRRAAGAARTAAISTFCLELVELLDLVFLENLFDLGAGLSHELGHLLAAFIAGAVRHELALLLLLVGEDGTDGLFLIFGEADGFFHRRHLAGEHLLGVTATTTTLAFGGLGITEGRQQSDCCGKNELGKCVPHDLSLRRDRKDSV